MALDLVRNNEQETKEGYFRGIVVPAYHSALGYVVQISIHLRCLLPRLELLSDI